MEIIQTLLATIVTLGILVTIHEWGHFWVARRCGVQVLRFSIGFGKSLWLRKGKDGTEYSVAAIPLGGYVKMLDEREGPVPEHLRSQAFNNKPVMQRIAIVAAGPAVNLIFAVFAYWLMFVVGVSTVVPVVGSVVPGSVIAQAGVPEGVELVEIDGHRVRSWEEVNLRFASRIGESGALTLAAISSASAMPTYYDVVLKDWNVDLESESPLFAMGIQPYRPEVKPVLGQIIPGGAAEQAGLKVGDIVVEVNAEPIDNWQALVKIIQQSPDQELEFLIKRGTDVRNLRVLPASRQLDSGEIQGVIGAGVTPPQWPVAMLRTIQYGPVEAVGVAFNKTVHMVALTLDSIGKMIGGVISVKNLSGPITIAKVAGASAASGFEPFISFLAYLSISLGVLNLLPIPVLDGGHLLFYGIELVRGKPVSERVQVIGFKLGMALLLSLMTLAIVNDFMRL
ncbi:sigma E protease regulator RseP [Neptunomonas antarctica]|uniref:Zinc metalloprotease n=1 Tax=Neptunomonas antarctica TaxID=619304 RepID=A0A1N7J9A1_9GAMM|nr:sigma E protease regulator RseP [Neptunomonas antarctica]SIS45847.1 site-2 protease. Metallo peptidase. MEROPS family M50B [Neptunomonas antarctica]